MGLPHNKAQGRLCILLGLLVCNYYFCFSMSAESFDVEVDSYTRDNQWDVGKLLDRMSACPFVKLRGLASTKKRHNKAKTLSSFEVFIWFNVIAFIHLLRSLTALINTLLLRAGDVELNPGPGPPPEATTSPAHDEDKPSSASTSSPDTNQLTLASGEPSIHGQIKPLSEATSPDPNLSVARKGTVPDDHILLTAAVPNNTTQNFAAVNYLDASVPKSVEYSQIYGSLQAEEHLDTLMLVGQGVTVHKVKASTGKEPIRTCISDDEKDKLEHLVDLPVRKATKRKEKRRSEPPSSLRIYKRQLSRSKVQQQKDCVTSLRDELSNFEQLDRSTASKQLFELFTAANKLYRLGERCPVCPLCLKDKKNGGQRKSHVIPLAILDHYEKIHGTSEHKHGYIHDFSRNERLSAKGLHYQLLCGDCEMEYSKTEQSLLSLYLNIAANPHANLTLNHEDTNIPTLWLTYILANILLRGVLAHIDLDDRFQKQEIMDEIYSLWTFCTAKLVDATKMSTVPNLKVFFLPNKSFNQSLNDFLYPFEMVLRMPRCAELVQCKEGTFFNTKFDCIHVVLPLCETSRAYYETFNNGLVMENHFLHLRWALHPKTEINRQGKSLTFSYPPECSTIKDHFPEVLLSWCVELYKDIVSKIHSHPSLDWAPGAYVERYSGSKYTGFNTDERMQLAEVLKERSSIDEREYRIATYKDVCKEKLQTYVSDASKHSPLKKINDLMCLKRKLNAVLEEKALLEVELKKKTAALTAANEAAAEVRWNFKAELDQNAAVLDEEKERRQRWEEFSQSQCRSHKESLKKVKLIYLQCLRKNRTEEQETIEQLKLLISDMGADFEYFAEVTQDSDDIHQTYKELHEQCNALIAMSPLNSPSSPTPQSPYI